MAWPLDAEVMGQKKVNLLLLLCFFVLICFFLPLPISGDIITDRDALLAFKNSTGDNQSLVSWSKSSTSSICTNWTGITCSNASSSQRVTVLQLSNQSLSGQIPLSTLGKLDALQTLTLSSNHFSGELPSDLANCSSLRNISLQNNNFSGPLFASAFSSWPLLLQIDLSFNKFNGSIPQSITNVTVLQSLNLENNSFSGTIPNITAPSLKTFNVANNELEGQIPSSLSKFSTGSFAGNKELCGEPLNDTCSGGVSSPSPSPSPSPTSNPSISKSKNNGLSDGALVGIVMGATLGGCLLLVLFGLFASKNKSTKVHVGSNQRQIEDPVHVEVPNVEEEGLVFVEKSNKEAFDIDSLLRASAEVLGKGTLGMAYKAMLEDGLVLVVKRLHFICRDDYKKSLLVLANLKHPNLIPFKAWYFSKNEKFLVYDYIRHGSLHAHLHGEKLMEWERRLSVAGTVANALAYIHAQEVVHGDLKSTNVIMNSEGEACIIDYGLVPVAVRIVGKHTGYTPPEVIDLSKMTCNDDVYSFGVLLLELLTGKSPLPAAGKPVIDLPSWVQSVVHEQWTAEVFDLEIMKFEYIQEEMMELLQIALQCVSPSSEQRPSMADLVIAIENLRSSDSEESFHSP